MKKLFIAISFFTIIPLPTGEVSCDDLQASAGLFPVAGLVVGLMLTILAWVGLNLLVPELILAVILVGGWAWLTRGLHLDGVADLCDGLGGSFDRERRLAIMKDSSTGAFGVIGLLVVLLLKVAGLYYIFFDFQELILLLIILPAVPRFVMLVVAALASYPREVGTGHFLVGKVGVTNCLIGLIFLLPLAVYGQLGLFLLIGSAGPFAYLFYKANKELGGVTGDVLGAGIEWGEAMALVMLAWGLSLNA